MKLRGYLRPSYLINAFVIPVFCDDKDNYFTQIIENYVISEFEFIEVETQQIISDKYLENIEVGRQEGQEAFYIFISDSKKAIIYGTKKEIVEPFVKILNDTNQFDENPFPKVLISSFLGTNHKTSILINITNSFFELQKFNCFIDRNDFITDIKKDSEINEILNDFNDIQITIKDSNNHLNLGDFIFFNKEKDIFFLKKSKINKKNILEVIDCYNDLNYRDDKEIIYYFLKLAYPISPSVFTAILNENINLEEIEFERIKWEGNAIFDNRDLDYLKLIDEKVKMNYLKTIPTPVYE